MNRRASPPRLSLDRRRLIAGGLAAALTLGARGGVAAPTAMLTADDGSPMRSHAAPEAEKRTAAVGAQRFGAASGAALIEAFDYNCGFCRAAAHDLDALLDADPGFALTLLHLPILSPGSVEAAAVQVAVHRRHGLVAARRLHVALLAHRGFVDGAKARALAQELDVPAEAGPEALADVAAQRSLAAELGMRGTPTFVMAGTAFVGWPGRKTIETFTAAARTCGRITCG